MKPVRKPIVNRSVADIVATVVGVHARATAGKHYLGGNGEGGASSCHPFQFLPTPLDARSPSIIFGRMFQCEFDHPCREVVRYDQSDWFPQSRLDIPTV